MASSYVNDLRLNEMATGDASGTWGTTTNTNLELIGEALGYGTEGITTNADTHTSTIADGATDPVRAMYVEYTGTLDSACTITIAPNTVNRMQFIENGTSGSQNIIISQGSGANITIPPGDVKAVYLDGAGSGAAVVDAFASLNVVDLKVQDDLTVTDDATIGGTLGVTGIVTLTDDLIIGDGKTIGSASDVDAMTIAANGQITLTQTLIGTALDISGDIDVDGTTNLDNTDIDGTLDVSGQATFADGSAGAPSISNTGDVNAGLFFSAADVMSFSAGGTAQFTMADGSISPVTDNDIDLGTASLKYKSFFAGLVDSENFKINGGQGDDGQVLTSTGSGVAWEAASGGATDINGLSDAKTFGTGSIMLGDTTTGTIDAANYNYGFGVDVFHSLTSGDANIAIGFSALNANTSGSFNTAIGHFALDACVSDSNNVAIGHQTLEVCVGSNNTAVGSGALNANTTGPNSTAVGQGALASHTTGGNNTAVGYKAGDAITTGDQGTYIGQDAGGAGTTGSNTAVGAVALTTQILGTRNTAIGYGAMQLAGGDGASNLLVNNTAVGQQAMYNHDKDDCTAVGMQSLFTMTTGTRNVALGGGAGYSVTSGADNTTLGVNAGYAITTGVRNVCVGKFAGGYLTTGGDNTIVGFNAGTEAVQLATGSQNVIIGNYADVSSGTGAVAANIFGYDVNGANDFTTVGNGTDDIRAAHGTATWATVSDERVKKDIADSTVGLNFINELRPVTFNYKNKGDVPKEFRGYEEGSTETYKYSTTNHGFIAQEVKAVIDNHTDIADGFKLWDVRETGQQEVAEAALIPMLVKAIQELSAEVEKLKGE